FGGGGCGWPEGPRGAKRPEALRACVVGSDGSEATGRGHARGGAKAHALALLGVALVEASAVGRLDKREVAQPRAEVGPRPPEDCAGASKAQRSEKLHNPIGQHTRIITRPSVAVLSDSDQVPRISASGCDASASAVT